MKVGASIAVCRRGGASATFDVLNKYFTISGMPIVSSQYWNSVHGRDKGEAERDEEGLHSIVFIRIVLILISLMDLRIIIGFTSLFGILIILLF